MTFNPPTKTNPPWTSPPTWPFPTTGISEWEPDYRLRLLEAAIIYMWTAGTSGSAGCVAVGATAPPHDGSTIAPPEGYLWVDTSTSPTVVGMNYARITTSETWTIPAGVTTLRIRAQGGGGGGGGGGSSQITTPVAQVGGSGGAAGPMLDVTVAINPSDTSLTITIGNGGVGGTGGAAGSGATGNAGTIGAQGGSTRVRGTQSLVDYAYAATAGGPRGGSGGRQGGASSTTPLAAGQNNGSANLNVSCSAPGDGGYSVNNTGVALPNGACGGSAGGSASATTPFNGGGGGIAIGNNWAGVSMLPGGTATQSTPTGGDGQTPGTATPTPFNYGSGGAGGGGGGAGGAGGNGGNGAPGCVEIWW